MNSLPAGLSDRLLSVIRHIGLRVARISTGTAANKGCLLERPSITPGSMVRNGPFATSTLIADVEGALTVARGTSRPRTANTSRISRPKKLDGGHNAHGSSTNSRSLTLRRRAPPVVLTADNGQLIVEQYLRVHILFGRTDHAPNRNLDVAASKLRHENGSGLDN
jgi:hypothetical protein